ncbi:DUF2442 domain-containing protein [Desulfatirhabdium butyrativorans]|uniref:DUF2442 domain-containing protein n=1 Tax=Desulfatirhabdium butyrativorans TaxID=340467 RepID=UPI0004087F5C|nr:DUF2442 domain-containing protein [Desulfatirhabdium butyrativorans]
MIQILEATYIEGFKIALIFNTGEKGVVDLTDVVQKYDAAAPLRNPKEFEKFYLDEWPTLAWSCGFDLSPESLYERATGKKISWITE